MNKKTALGLILLLLTPPRVALAAKVPLSQRALKQVLGKANLLEKEQKIREAEKLYENLGKIYSLTPSQERKIRVSEEAFNIRMIFSKAWIDGSKIHTVQKGESLAMIAKKYNTTVELLRKSNGVKEAPIQPGLKLKVMSDPFKIAVDKSENRLTLYLKNKRIKHYQVTTGSHNKTPAGTFSIVNKVKNPIWYWGNRVIPAESKKNRLGTRWMGLDKESFGIHGTIEPEMIGRQASLGCVRMLNRDVEELYAMIPLHTQVKIAE